MDTQYKTIAEQLDEMDNNFVLWYALGKYISELQEKHDKIQNVNDLPKLEALAYLHERETLLNAHQIRDILDYELWR